MRILPTEDTSIAELFVDNGAASELLLEDDWTSEAVIRTGKLVVKLDSRTVEVEGHPVRLTRKEYGILELLSLHKGTTLNQEMFLNHLYGGTDEPAIKIIDVFICKLRKKLSVAIGGDNYIKDDLASRLCAVRSAGPAARCAQCPLLRSWARQPDPPSREGGGLCERSGIPPRYCDMMEEAIYE